MIIPCEFGAARISDILERVRDAALVNHTLCVHQFHRSAQTTTPSTAEGGSARLRPWPLASPVDEGGLPTLHASRSRQSANPQFLVFLCHSRSRTLMPPR